MADIQSENSNLFRVLSRAILINSQEFAKATPAVQTATLAAATPGLAVVFVKNFVDLANRKAIIDKLLTGDDVALELEFNGIDLSAYEEGILSAVRPILTRLSQISDKYPWLDQPGGDFGLVISKSRITRRDQGHFIGIVAAKRVWNFASAYWAGGTQPRSEYIQVYANDRKVTYESDHITLGCQKIPRVQVEYIARALGWQPNLTA